MQAYKNAWSMDGLPGMKRGTWAAKEFNVAPIKKMVGPLAPTQYTAGVGWNMFQVLLIALLSFLLGSAITLYAPVLRQMVIEATGQSKADLSFSNFTSPSFYREIISHK